MFLTRGPADHPLVPDSADFFSELTLDYHVRPVSQD
jgi:hypothetical protein